MNIFQSVLSELSKKIQKHELYKKEITEEITKITGIPLADSQVQIKKGVVRLLVSPTLKSFILLKKKELDFVKEKYHLSAIE